MLSFDWDNRIECCSEVRLTLSRDVITVITAYGKYTRVGRYAATNLCAQNSLHKRVLSKIERDIYSHGVAEEGHRVVERAPPINQFSSLSNLEENKVAFDLSREYISETLLLSYTESKGCFHEKMLQRSTDRGNYGSFVGEERVVEELVPSFIEGHRYIESTRSN